MNDAPGPSLRHVLILLGIVALGIAAVLIAKHMGDGAVSVVVGVICGVAAAIPTSLLLLAVLTRSERRRLEGEGRVQRYGQRPPVIMPHSGRIQVADFDPSAAHATYYANAGEPLPQPRIVGADGGAHLLEDRRYGRP